jgi:hypothetical protein
MKRTISVVVVAAALAALLADGSAAGRSNSAVTTLRLRAQVVHAQYIDNPPAGRSAGDDLIFTENLFNAAGTKVGSDAATCVYLFDQRSLCTGAYILPRGQILVQLVQPGPTGIYNQAITGGTGKYARVTGTVTVDQRPSGDHFTFHIHQPGS